jgi:hypothetical protein
MSQSNVMIPNDLHKRMKIVCANTGELVKDFVAAALRKHLESSERKLKAGK